MATHSLEINDRKYINSMVRMLACDLKVDYTMDWSILYKQLKYYHGINLKAEANAKSRIFSILKKMNFQKCSPQSQQY